MGIPDGPPIRRLVTPYDEALSCVGSRVPRALSFAVGAINDATGKESYADGGSGKMVTQGAGDMIQTALFNSGVRVVNRRDPSIAATEHNWGIRDIAAMSPADLFVTGSINSLDFIPGGGASVSVAGMGPYARQNRLLVGMDLALTNAITGEIVANVAVQKQLVGEEIGFAVGRFFGTRLVDASAGAMVREAMNMVLRQMLYYGAYQLLVQAHDAEALARNCNEKLTSTIAEDLLWDDDVGRATFQGIVREVEAAKPVSEAEVVEMRTQMTASPPLQMSAEARSLANNVTRQSARALGKFDEVVAAKTVPDANAAFEKGKLYLALAVRDLRAAAGVGLTGPEGDAVATLVEQAIRAAGAAEVALAALRQTGASNAPTVSVPDTANTPDGTASTARPSQIDGRP